MNNKKRVKNKISYLIKIYNIKVNFYKINMININLYKKNSNISIKIIKIFVMNYIYYYIMIFIKNL